jgi:hypothetical protein
MVNAVRTEGTAIIFTVKGATVFSVVAEVEATQRLVEHVCPIGQGKDLLVAVEESEEAQ